MSLFFLIFLELMFYAYRFMFLKGHVTSPMIYARTEDHLTFKWPFWWCCCCIVLVLLFVFETKVFLCSPGWPEAHSVDCAGLELTDNMSASAFPVLGLKTRRINPSLIQTTFNISYKIGRLENTICQISSVHISLENRTYDFRNKIYKLKPLWCKINIINTWLLS